MPDAPALGQAPRRLDAHGQRPAAQLLVAGDSLVDPQLLSLGAAHPIQTGQQHASETGTRLRIESKSLGLESVDAHVCTFLSRPLYVSCLCLSGRRRGLSWMPQESRTPRDQGPTSQRESPAHQDEHPRGQVVDTVTKSVDRRRCGGAMVDEVYSTASCASGIVRCPNGCAARSAAADLVQDSWAMLLPASREVRSRCAAMIALVMLAAAVMATSAYGQSLSTPVSSE